MTNGVRITVHEKLKGSKELRVFVPRDRAEDWHRAGTLLVSGQYALALLAIIREGCKVLGVECEIVK